MADFRARHYPENAPVVEIEVWGSGVDFTVRGEHAVLSADEAERVAKDLKQAAKVVRRTAGE